MAMVNHSWEEQTEKLLTETISELKTQETKRQELEDSIVTLTRRKEAYEIVLQDYRRRGVKGGVEPDWLKLLKGQINKKRLQIIAQQNGGKLKISQASRILYSNKGLTKARKHATVYQMVQGLAAELTEQIPPIFKKTGPGEFTLVGGAFLSSWQTEDK